MIFEDTKISRLHYIYRYVALAITTNLKAVVSLIMAMFAIISVEGQVTINEFIASNSLGIEDVDFANNSDWVELHNAGPSEIDISGWHLTDNLSDTTKWTLPSGRNAGSRW